MSQHAHDIIARGDARIVDAPKAAPALDSRVDRSFNLPTSLFAATVGCYFAFLAIMWAAFANPVLAIPMVLFAVVIVAGFGVPAIFTRLKGNDSHPMTSGQLRNDGIMTYSGRLAPRDAAIQVLILPVLIVLWGLAAVTIAALV